MSLVKIASGIFAFVFHRSLDNFSILFGSCINMDYYQIFYGKPAGAKPKMLYFLV